nr:LAGLIDADG family homing endonuclease [Clostridium sp. Marseille-P7770]
MKNGVPNYNEIVFTKEQKENIVKLYVEDKLSTPKIGKIMGCNYNKICRILDEFNIKRVNNGIRIYHLNESYFDCIDTPNKAYVLGLMCADGCNFPPKHTAFISLQESDKDLLEKIRKEMDSDQPLRIIDQSKRNDNNYTYNNMCTFNMYSTHICDSLTKLGVVRNKSLTLEFPNIPEYLYSHFVRGYFDGDGSIYQYVKNKNNKSIRLTFTSTDSFCKKLKEIIENKLGIYCGIYDASCHNGITKVLALTGSSSIKLLNWMYEDADLFLQRKYDRFMEYTAA